ncbi:MAG: hypothetical protein ABSG74_10610 [Candidatus Bathyarchaeia archaeon]|jgi:hypothetical protein
MMAEPQDERTISLREITPASEPEILCSHCLRPYPGKKQLAYICEACGAAHYHGEFYVCCPTDAERPLNLEDDA